MDMEVRMDFSEPLVDLSYMGIEGLDLDQKIDPVKALVLSGNPISDYQFLDKFISLVLLHCDNVSLKDISEFSVVGALPKLQVLVFRGNDLSKVDTMPELPKLKHLDLACNPDLEIGILSIPALQKFYFGVPAPLAEYETQKTCYSHSRVNTLQAFQDLFLSRYKAEQVVFARKETVLLGNTIFKFSANNRRVSLKIQKTDADAKVPNVNVNIRLYSLVQGVEIAETRCQDIELQTLAKLAQPLAPLRAFASPEYFYPTQHDNELALDQELAMLRAVQLKRGKNYCVIVIEMEGRVGVVLADHQLNFYNYFDELQAVQLVVDVVNGVSVRITKGTGKKGGFDTRGPEEEQADYLPMARHGLEVELEPESDEYDEEDDQGYNGAMQPSQVRQYMGNDLASSQGSQRGKGASIRSGNSGSGRIKTTKGHDLANVLPTHGGY